MGRQQEGRGDEGRWRAVRARDRRADGRFVYAVTSTGVYCRPSCPSRRPRPDRVEYYETPAEAERKGFRPCRRCRPTLPATDPWPGRIADACALLERASGRPTLAWLSARVGGSPFHLHRNFTRLVGVTPRAYVDACRLRRVRRGLRSGLAIADAAFDAGYGSSSRFYERAAPRLGMTPVQYQHGGAGMEIRYGVMSSPLGRLLVAATDRGVCAVIMGASDREVLRSLAREYPAAHLAPDARGIGRWAKPIVALVRGRRNGADLPLDVRATAFQWKVWQQLTRIPCGRTISYGELAAAIGRPTAVRAVARACATNPVAVAIPCHRVVQADGGMGGYRWGVARKRKLLEMEKRK